MTRILRGRDMKVLKETLFYMVTVVCVLGCIKLCAVKEEQKRMLKEADSPGSEIEVGENDAGTESQDAVWQYYNPDGIQLILEEKEQTLSGLEDEIQVIQLKCDLQKLLEDQSNISDSASRIYQKYFRVRQGEMARIEGLENLSECETFGFLNNPFSGVVFPLYDGILLQYENGTTSQIGEYSLPIAVIIHGSESGLGYMGARPGMDFEQIKDQAGEAEMCKGFMYFDNKRVYYLQYEDNLYVYSFVSDYEDGRDSNLIVTQTSEELSQVGWTQKDSEPKETVFLHWMEACEFEQIEKNHEILQYDIASAPRYDYENTPLQAYLEEEKKENQRLVDENGSACEMRVDYHVFDFNDDGIEDYLLCIDGSLYSGTAGHDVEIYVGKEDGSVERVLSINLRFHNESNPSGHERFTVLNEKTDGYYTIVLPGSNRILRYDKEEGGYVFQETE